jgi:hypothetical protein
MVIAENETTLTVTTPQSGDPGPHYHYHETSSDTLIRQFSKTFTSAKTDK